MKHFASPDFWACFSKLPEPIQLVARKNYQLLKKEPQHPSLHYKHVGNYRPVRIGRKYRALGTKIDTGILWFWIGSHADYDHLLH